MWRWERERLRGLENSNMKKRIVMGQEEDAWPDPCLSAPALTLLPAQESAGTHGHSSASALPAPHPTMGRSPLSAAPSTSAPHTQTSLKREVRRTVPQLWKKRPGEGKKNIYILGWEHEDFSRLHSSQTGVNLDCNSHRASEITVNYDIIEEKSTILCDDDHIILSANKIKQSHLFLLSL